MCKEYQKITLDNGLSCIGYQNSKVQSINMSLYFRAGVMYESSYNVGISHLLEHLFFRRLRGINQKELYYSMEKIGTTLRAKTYRDFIRFDISVSPIYFYQAYEIISGIFADNEWTDEDIEKEKAVVLKQIQFKATPSFNEYINARYLKGMKISRPIMGTEESVKRASAKTINSWKKKIFIPNNSCFIITGNYSSEHFEYVKRELSKYRSSDRILKNDLMIPKMCFERNEKSDYIIDTEWEISDVTISFDIRKDYCFEAEFLSSIIGGGVGSRLSLILREELAITDEVYSSVDIFEDVCRFNIEFSTENSDLESGLKYAFNEIFSVKEEISEEDLENSKVFFTENQKWFLDDPRELNFLLGWRGFILKQPISDINSIIDIYSNLSRESLSKVAREIFNDSNLIITVTNNNGILKKSKLKQTIVECRNTLQN